METLTSSIDKFSFQPEKVAVETVYHYLKTNIDGTSPERISLRVAGLDRLEAFKFHPGGDRAALVVAEMDWANFCAKKLESWQVFGDGRRDLFATMSYLAPEQAIQIDAPGMGRSPDEAELVPIGFLPFHMYNFDLSSLNFSFRHLCDPEATFNIGLTDPTFKADGPMVYYRGEVTLRYAGDEVRNNVSNRKYHIDGPGLENRGGFIWVNKAGEYVEDIEIDLPDNPSWQSFKFHLQGIDQMDQASWTAFMMAQF